MGTFEVTQAQWERVMGENPSYLSSGGKLANYVEGMNTESFPVEMVSYQDVARFIDRLNSRFGVDGFKYRLPTEAEWEYACRGGTETAFHFGNILTGKVANCDGNYPYASEKKGPSLQRTAHVGSYKENVFGLHDMSGNVFEWCSDWYDDEYKTSPARDPLGPLAGSRRVVRGGAWEEFASHCRSAFRHGYPPEFRTVVLGFRVVLSR